MKRNLFGIAAALLLVLATGALAYAATNDPPVTATQGDVYTLMAQHMANPGLIAAMHTPAMANLMNTPAMAQLMNNPDMLKLMQDPAFQQKMAEMMNLPPGQHLQFCREHLNTLPGNPNRN